MKAEQKYFEDQAHFNKWLYELSDTERDHIEFMLKEYAESQLKEERELLRNEFKLEFYRKLKAKLNKILNGDLNLWDYKYEVLEKIDNLKP
jgi:hypothetical protein